MGDINTNGILVGYINCRS